MSLQVTPLTADTWPAVAALFAQGGDPKGCGCMWWRMSNQEWQSTSIPDRHAAMGRLASGGEPPGLVGFVGDEAAAWVSVGPIPGFTRVARSKSLPAPPASDNAWAILCLVVGKAHRGKAFATTMVEAAAEHARANGASKVIGYPVETEGSRIASASAYTGTVAMFRDCGFDVVSPTTSKAGGKPRLLVERRLS